jgi:light-independent protochlorophyllide reductase subunit B
VREAAKLYGVEALITDDYLEVEAKVAELQPELVLGTQMERHIAKRLGMPCAVISAPVHVQDFPRATRRRWASKAPTCCSTPGCTR